MDYEALHFSSFENPAAAFGRMFSDSFAGIALSGVPAFMAAQISGAALAVIINSAFAGAPVALEVAPARTPDA